MGTSRILLTTSLFLALASGASAQDDLQRLMGQPARGLSAADLELFVKGRTAFDTALTDAEGLGPIFNEPACGSCHNHPTSGGSSTRAVTRFGKLGPPFDDLAALGGSLLQDQSIDISCRETVPPEADVIAKRLTPICFGAGLLEAVDDADILWNEANQPPHLNGKSSPVPDLSDPTAPLRPARFGWKGVLADPMSFSIDAGLNEMGLTSIFAPNENAPNGDQALLAACDNVADPEDGPDAGGKTRLERFTDFQRFLAGPPQTPVSGMTGEALFNQVGCVDCHRAGYVTGSSAVAALNGRSIQPYSDFLLHDMGVHGDQIAQGNASEGEMQTRALWGLALRTSFMHDGRVTGGTFRDNMLACVQEHGSAGDFSRTAFNSLSTADQDAVVAFLASLGRAEFDFEFDNDLDEFDWFFIEPFLTGPVPTYTPDSPEAFCDVDRDGDFDLLDFGLFQRGFTGQTSQPPMPLPPASASLRFSVVAGKTAVWIAPGSLLRYQVTGELSDKKNQGLAMVSFDLAFDGGALPPADFPDHAPMTHFASDLGLSNPAGFGGTPSGGDLLQIGGAQNSINNTFAPRPSAPVITGVAERGTHEVLAEGSFTAPTTPGTYHLTLSQPQANVFEKNTTGTPYWEVQAVENTAIRDLVVHVQDCAPKVYCTSKPTSEGCSPSMRWKGLPSATGADDFHLYATGLVPNKTAIFFWGLAPANLPFMGGTLCVGGTLVRTKVDNTGGQGECAGRLDFRMSQNYMANKGLVVGTQVYAQTWFRDPAQPDGTGVGLSDAIEFKICP